MLSSLNGVSTVNGINTGEVDEDRAISDDEDGTLNPVRFMFNRTQEAIIIQFWIGIGLEGKR